MEMAVVLMPCQLSKLIIKDVYDPITCT